MFLELLMMMSPGLLLTDYTSESSDLGWFVVNDDVMGGRSEGSTATASGELSFAGRTNTNGGGFSSIRTKPLEFDLSKHSGIQLRVKGDGRRYTWGLTSDALWRGREVSYWADFEARDAEWSVVSIPFSNFIPKFRGKELDGPALDPGLIKGLALMIYDNAYSATAPTTATLQLDRRERTGRLSISLRW